MHVILWLDFIAGIGIFLFAMHQLETALQAISGPSLRTMLLKATSSSFGSVLSGTLATAILQSSSMVGLMVLAMVGAGILPLTNAVGMVIGANLGTTITGWLVTLLGFKLSLSQLDVPLMGCGAIIYLIQRNRDAQSGWGLFMFAIGLLIFGLDMMKTSVAAVSSVFHPEQYAHLHSIWFVLIGVVFTAVIQSSSAMMMITLSALSAGVLSFPAAAALIIGADLGTTSTMLIGAIQGSANKRRVAMSHVIFNLFTALFAYLIILPLLPQLLELAGLTDPLFGLVAFHSFFNLIGVLLMLPFLRPFAAKLAGWFGQPEPTLCRYLNDVQAADDPVSLAALDKEFGRLYQLCLGLNTRALRLRTGAAIDEELANFGHGYENQYRGLKELNGRMVEFILDINCGDETVKSSLHKRLKALRELHYALKCVKDIREDLMQFELSVVRKLRGIAMNRIETDGRHFSRLTQLIGLTPSPDLNDELDNIIAAAALSHEHFVAEVYELLQQDSLSSKELATLVNTSKHIQQCIDGLVSSLRSVQGLTTSVVTSAAVPALSEQHL